MSTYNLIFRACRAEEWNVVYADGLNDLLETLTMKRLVRKLNTTGKNDQIPVIRFDVDLPSPEDLKLLSELVRTRHFASEKFHFPDRPLTPALVTVFSALIMSTDIMSVQFGVTNEDDAETMGAAIQQNSSVQLMTIAGVHAGGVLNSITRYVSAIRLVAVNAKLVCNMLKLRGMRGSATLILKFHDMTDADVTNLTYAMKNQLNSIILLSLECASEVDVTPIIDALGDHLCKIVKVVIVVAQQEVVVDMDRVLRERKSRAGMFTLLSTRNNRVSTRAALKGLPHEHIRLAGEMLLGGKAINRPQTYVEDYPSLDYDGEPDFVGGYPSLV